MPDVYLPLIKILSCACLLGLAPAFSGAEPTSGNESAAGFAYRVGTATGTALVPEGGVYAGDGGFRLVLVPESGEAWDMSTVGLLGVQFHNHGETDLILDLRLANPGATDWSNSALGRTVVRAGESLPLAVGLPRAGSGEPHPAFLRMSGWPDGRFRHWHHIDPQRVVRFEIQSRSSGPHRFSLGALFPVRSLRPELLAARPFIDRYGQYRHADWPGKIASDEQLRATVAAEAAWAATLGEIPNRSRFGGWAGGPRLAASGRFRVEQVDGHWWFVDPEGYLFFSHGVTGVGFENAGRTSLRREVQVFQALPPPDDPVWGQFYEGAIANPGRPGAGWPATFDFGQANLVRKYGVDTDWWGQALAQQAARMRYAGLNTLAAWSSADVIATARLPYTAIVHAGGAQAASGVPDPFDPRLREGLRQSLRQQEVSFKDDPYCLGVFVNNELHWTGNAKALVTSVLRHTPRRTEAKATFRDWLRGRHGSLEAFNAAWQVNLSDWDDLLTGLAGVDLTGAAVDDCSALATLLADRYYGLVNEELKAYAPEVLNLGSRFHVGCPEVVAAAALHVDVISVNHYQYEPHPGNFGRHGKPVLISEYHFGNLTGRNLGSGLRNAADATQQARLFRHFVEQAVADPMVIGTHWFQWRDQNVGGRADGENYDIGFIDITDQPKPELIEASAAVSRTLYEHVQ